MIRAVLFDLDGTLLPLDIDEFFKAYIALLCKRFASLVRPCEFAKRLMASTHKMLANDDPTKTLREVFWQHFSEAMQSTEEEILPAITEFYTTEYASLGKHITPDPEARRVVEAALNAGYQIVLATNPLFPLIAIKERMGWAGIDKLPWRLITSYENMHFAKPNPSYYAEIADAIGVLPDSCVMVGNDLRDDLAASVIGMKTFCVEGFVVKTPGGYSPVWQGSLSDLGLLIERRFGA